MTVDLTWIHAIAAMRSPGERSRDHPENPPIICVDVTNRCDLRCSNCTRLLANQRQHWDMTQDNFRMALRSLDDFPGIIAMIGGNPCCHPEFGYLCGIFEEEIADKGRRGLWSNNVMDYQEICARTFGFWNLNPHGDKRCIESLEKLKQFVPNLRYYAGHSEHAPLLAAVKDIISDEREMWDAISKCDINRNWSASIVQNKGNLRGYFCEVAASFDLARGEDRGVPIVEGWWKKGITEFSDQIKHFCPGCGVPAKLKGRLDYENTDDYTVSNRSIAANTRGHRKTVPVTDFTRADHAVTAYTESHRRPKVPTISVVIPCYNAAETLAETIASVFSQEAPPGALVEVIVSDDGSTDNSCEIASQIPGVGIFRAENGGPAAARNRGLKVAKGEFVCFLDADDTYAPGFFEFALGAFSKTPSMAALVTDIELVNSHREVEQAHLNAMVHSLPSNMIIRRAVADVLGGFPEDPAFRGKRAGEDIAFKQVLGNHFVVGWVKHPFLRYRVTRGSHFDLFLDSSVVVDGQLQMINETVEDEARKAATMVYLEEVARRLAAVEGCRKREAQPTEDAIA